MSSHVHEGSDLDGAGMPGTIVETGGRGSPEPTSGQAPVGVDLVDLEGRTTWTNGVLGHSLGYSEEEFATMPLAAITHPDDVEAQLDRFAQLVDGKIDRFAMEKRFIRRDGGTLWVALTMSLVAEGQGRPGYVIGVTQDITDRKLLESDSPELGQRSQLQVERVPAIVYVAEPGPNGRWLYVSPQIESILGFSAQEWMADPGLWQKQLHPQDRENVIALEERLLIASETVDGVYSDTYRLRHRTGATVWVRDDGRRRWGQDRWGTRHGVPVDLKGEEEPEARLEAHALHDPLTGVANRKLFHEDVGHVLAG